MATSILFDRKDLMQQVRMRATFPHDVMAAVLTGQLAGLIMALAMMAVFTLVLERTPVFPVQLIASFIFGEEGLQGFQPVAFLCGLVIHQLGPALMWSLVFGMLVYGLQAEDRAVQMLLGLFVGILSQVVDVGILVPTLFGYFQDRDLWAEHVPALWSWVAHVVYGLGLGLYPLMDDLLARRS